MGFSETWKLDKVLNGSYLHTHTHTHTYTNTDISKYRHTMINPDQSQSGLPITHTASTIVLVTGE